jgi:hypothetical protein
MEILASNVTLVDDRKRNPQSRAIVGDVAMFESGRVVARYRTTFGDGTSSYACRDYRLDGDCPVLSGGAVPKDWSTWMREELERGQGAYRLLHEGDHRSAKELEFADFRRRFPHTAAFVNLPVPVSRSPLFEVGQVRIPSRWPDIDWHHLLSEHDSGVFGIYGKYDHTPLSDEELWTLAEGSVLNMNKAAIASQSGPIRSRYRLSPSRTVAVVTVLSPHAPRTLITLGFTDADLAGHP